MRATARDVDGRLKQEKWKMACILILVKSLNSKVKAQMRILFLLQEKAQQIISQQYLHASPKSLLPLKLAAAYISRLLPRPVSQLIGRCLIGWRAFLNHNKALKKTCNGKLSSLLHSKCCLCLLLKPSVTRKGAELRVVKTALTASSWDQKAITKNCFWRQIGKLFEKHHCIVAAYPCHLLLFLPQCLIDLTKRNGCRWIINCLCLCPFFDW